jgi:sugar phosphate isomerase/epimerase
MTVFHQNTLTRRSFLAAPAAAALAQRKRVPIGLELYSVRDEMKTDVKNVLRQVAKMGYEVVEFYAVYFDYPVDQAKELRRLMDELKIRCVSTHNAGKFLEPEHLSRTIELNQILGSTQIIQASAGRITSLKGWQEVAERLNQVAEKLRPLKMRTGFHNHAVEFQPLEGKLPIDVIGENTAKDVILQLDVGAAVSAGGDPVAFMKRYPGRIASMHVKDWSPEPDKGFRVLLGEGAVNWKEVFRVAETVGGIEYYLIEQEGSAYPPMETVERCLKTMRRLRA